MKIPGACSLRPSDHHAAANAARDLRNVGLEA